MRTTSRSSTALNIICPLVAKPAPEVAGVRCPPATPMIATDRTPDASGRARGGMSSRLARTVAAGHGQPIGFIQGNAKGTPGLPVPEPHVSGGRHGGGADRRTTLGGGCWGSIHCHGLIVCVRRPPHTGRRRLLRARPRSGRVRSATTNEKAARKRPLFSGSLAVNFRPGQRLFETARGRRRCGSAGPG